MMNTRHWLLMPLLALAIPSASFSAETCQLGNQNDCKKNEVCMSGNPSSSCRGKPAEAPIDFILPFDSRTEVVCTHSRGIGSHSWPNAFYALDLATPYEKPADTILAAADGKAFVFPENELCAQPEGSPARAKTDNCGNGWGNHVKILHAGGYYSFYVHLEKVLIKNGQTVKQGEPIGIEGWTGLAGHRHLHWSIQKIEGRDSAEIESRISWDGSSVPFHFQAIHNGKNQIIKSDELECPHANIGEVPPDRQPRFNGVVQRSPSSESNTSSIKLPSPSIRKNLFEDFRATIDRIDGDGLIPRANRSESWQKTTENLKKKFVSAKNLFEMGQVLKQMDQTYPNLHSSISLNKEIDMEGAEGRIKPAITFQPELVAQGQKDFRYRLSNTNQSLFLQLSPDDRPQFGDELLSINGKLMRKWSDENFLFCKYPLREQCEVDFWDSFRKELRSWNRRIPLVAELKRGNRKWKINVPIIDQTQSSGPSPESKDAPCGIDPKIYAPFELAYEGRNACAYENKKQPGIVLLRIKSFNYRSDNQKIKNIREETKQFWDKYWNKKAASTQKLVIDVSDNGGGDSVVSWYRLFFSEPFQEQYAQFKNIAELKTREDIRKALFYDEEAKEIFFKSLEKDGSLSKLQPSGFLPPVPQFCATEDKDCREELFKPIDNNFRGEVRIVLNQWCHSSCVGFVWNMKDVLKDRVKFIGQPDDGDSTYGRVLIGARLDASTKGYSLTVEPRHSGQRAQAKDGLLFEQAVSRNRNKQFKWVLAFPKPPESRSQKAY